MRKDEVIIRILNNLDDTYGEKVNQQEVKEIIEGVLCDFDVTPKVTALALVNDMQDKIMLYLAVKKLEGLASSSISAYGRCLKRFSEYIVMNVDDVATMDIRRYLVEYSQTGVKDTTIANTTDILRGLFDWLKIEEYITRNPMDKIKTIKALPEIREPLTPEELEIFYGGCKTLRQLALAHILASTGCRLAEIEGLRKQDVNWEMSKIQVVGKGSKPRIVYFNAKARVHLRNYLDSREDDCDAIFVTERKPIKFMGRRAIQSEIDKIQRQSGLKSNVYPHRLRHTYATNGLRNGMSVTTIQRLLGHSNLTTTQIYSKTSNDAVEYEYKKHMNS